MFSIRYFEELCCQQWDRYHSCMCTLIANLQYSQQLISWHKNRKHWVTASLALYIGNMIHLPAALKLINKLTYLTNELHLICLIRLKTDILRGYGLFDCDYLLVLMCFSDATAVNCRVSPLQHWATASNLSFFGTWPSFHLTRRWLLPVVTVFFLRSAGHNSSQQVAQHSLLHWLHDSRVH